MKEGYEVNTDWWNDRSTITAVIPTNKLTEILMGKNNANGMNDFDVPLSSTTTDILKSTLTVNEKDILELADEMASAMSDMNAHNYKNFVDARDKFRDKIKEMCNETIKSYEKVQHMKKVIAEI